MSDYPDTKLIRSDDYVAEVDVELMDSDDEAWGPYLSLEDARKLDKVRLALERDDVGTALQYARVYRLTPVTAA